MNVKKLIQYTLISLEHEMLVNLEQSSNQLG